MPETKKNEYDEGLKWWPFSEIPIANSNPAVMLRGRKILEKKTHILGLSQNKLFFYNFRSPPPPLSLAPPLTDFLCTPLLTTESFMSDGHSLETLLIQLSIIFSYCIVCLEEGAPRKCDKARKSS